MSAILVYVTTRNEEEAARIGRALVDGRLAACVNILPGMRSIYRWEGRIEDARECVLIVKSDSERTDELVGRIKELHSYDCPCAIVLPILGGNPDYLDWLTKESRNA